MALKPLPIGIQSFSRIKEGGYLYVDKTQQILNLLSMGDCFFLARPRRFGKSLLLSTLQEIFAGNRSLFDDLDIAKSSYEWTKHPVVHLSFTSMKSKHPDQLEKDIEWTLLSIAQEYGISISDAPSIKTKFIALVKRLAHTNRAVILIDEYDYPLINNLDNLPLAEECRNVLHDFFVVLKDLSDYVRFICITGVSKFSKTSIFSGLNNLNDLTLSPFTATLLGYTQKELLQNFSQYSAQFAKKHESSVEELLADLKDWYNGYQFTREELSVDGESLKVYNPYSVLLYFFNGELANYWAETGTPTFLTHLLKKERIPLSQVDGSEVNAEDTKSYDIDAIKPMALLWQTGYLTIQSFDQKTQNYKLTYPNKEVKDSFFNFLITNLTHTELSAVKRVIVALDESLEKGDIALFLKILESYMATIPYPVHVPLEEHYQTIFYVVLSLLGMDVQVEVATHKGRIDAVVHMLSTIYVFEFKFHATAGQALSQIEEKKYYQRFLASKKRIILVGVQFDLEDRTIKEWVSKKVPLENE